MSLRVEATEVFTSWLKDLRDTVAKRRIVSHIDRIAYHGTLLGDCKSIGGALVELRFDVGPGYRVYASLQSGALMLLLVGATNQRNGATSPKLESSWEIGGREMLTTKPWDAAEHLTSPEDIAAYLSEALQDGDPGYFQHALGVIARAEGMSSLAASTGLNRENLYRTLSDDSNPRFQTVVRILDGLGLMLDVKPAVRSSLASARTNASIL